MSQIKAVLFDIDGTLIDSNELHVAAWLEAFSAAGLRFDAQTVRTQIGKGTDMLVPALVPNASDDLIESLGEAHGSIFKARYLEQAKPFRGARELLLHVDRVGKAVALASSASQAELDYYVSLLDVKAIVAASTTSDDVETSKPAPDIFGVALEKLSFTAAQAIAVGDTPYDIESAGKCGIAAVAVRSGKFSDDALQGAGAVALYDDVAALLADFDASPLAR